jgi:SAM-dependent methyltransferase
MSSKMALQSSNKTVESFGDEWQRFRCQDPSEFHIASNEYFDVLDFGSLNAGMKAIDVGCGTGRWSRVLAPHVGIMYGIDPSSALDVAKENCAALTNFVPVSAVAENLPFDSKSVDFAMSLGVLHHIEDTEKALSEIYRVLRDGGRFLFYFYYNLDNRPIWYKSLFLLSNIVRLFISSLPSTIKNLVCELIAILVYYPLVKIAGFVAFIFGNKIAQNMPLAYYCNKSFYIMRTDCRDRFGTPLEKRYSKKQLQDLLTKAGFSSITFSNSQPYWHGIAIK